MFADRARVTRARTVACEKGTARAVFERLPAALDTRTLRGEVREAAEVIGLVGEQVNEREAADPRARALAAELDKTAGRDQGQRGAPEPRSPPSWRTSARSASVFSATLAEEMRNPKPNTPAWAKTLDALRARRDGAGRRAPQAGRRAARPAADADKLRRQLAQVGGARRARVPHRDA